MSKDMEIAIDGVVIRTVTLAEQDVLANTVNRDNIAQRLEELITHSIGQLLKSSQQSLINEWESKLASRLEFIPTSKEALVELITSQEDYKEKKTKEAEKKTLEEQISELGV